MAFDFKKKECEVFVAGLVIDPVNNAPIVILKREGQKACLPIWVGPSEANAIALAIQGEEFPRPLTHDLLVNSVDICGAAIGKVSIDRLEGNTFYASVHLRQGERELIIDARPSDAVAIALRVHCPIFANVEVLKEAEVEIQAVDEEGDLISGEDSGRDMTMQGDQFSSRSEEEWEDILEDMDPEDFKYKV